MSAEESSSSDIGASNSQVLELALDGQRNPFLNKLDRNSSLPKSFEGSFDIRGLVNGLLSLWTPQHRLSLRPKEHSPTSAMCLCAGIIKQSSYGTRSFQREINNAEYLCDFFI